MITKLRFFKASKIILSNFFEGASRSATALGGILGLSYIIRQKITQLAVTYMFYHQSIFSRDFYVSRGVSKETPRKKTPLITNPTIAPRGLGIPSIAVAVLLSLSPNHLLQMGVTELKIIGPGKDKIVFPKSNGQNVPVRLVS